MTQGSKSFAVWLADSKAGRLSTLTIITAVGVWITLPGVLLVFIWKYLTKTKMKELGFSRPHNWVKTIVLGIVLGILLKLAFKSIIIPLVGVESSGGTFDFLKGNLGAALGFGLFVIVSAGFGEELIYRGYFFSRLTQLFGSTLKIKVLTVLIGSLIFGIPHIYQGTNGAIQATLMGIILGIMYFKNNGNLWLLIVLHSFFDLFAIYLIYSDLDSQVAHWFF
jgi:membrane protease YdiL (CAAX protease family)